MSEFFASEEETRQARIDAELEPHASAPRPHPHNFFQWLGSQNLTIQAQPGSPAGFIVGTTDDPAQGLNLGEVGLAVPRAIGQLYGGVMDAGAHLAQGFDTPDYLIPSYIRDDPARLAGYRAAHNEGENADLARWFAEQRDDVRERRAAIPRAQVQSQATQIVSGLVEVMLPAVIAGPAALVLSTEERTYTALRDQGAPEDVARGGAYQDAAWMAAMGVAPASIEGNILRRALYGAGLNLGFGTGMRRSMNAYLTEEGYPELASQYQWLDGTNMAIDALMGAAFGVAFGRNAPASMRRHGEIEPPPNEPPDTPAPDQPLPEDADGYFEEARQYGTDEQFSEAYAYALIAKDLGHPEADGLIETIEQDASADDLDAGRAMASEIARKEAAPRIQVSDLPAAALVEADSIHRETAFGVPADPASARWQADALDRMEKQAADGEAIDPGPVPDGVDFVPFPENPDTLDFLREELIARGIDPDEVLYSVNADERGNNSTSQSLRIARYRLNVLARERGVPVNRLFSETPQFSMRAPASGRGMNRLTPQDVPKPAVIARLEDIEAPTVRAWREHMLRSGKTGARPTIAIRIIELSFSKTRDGEYLSPTEIAAQMLREGFFKGQTVREGANSVDVRRSLLRSGRKGDPSREAPGIIFPALRAREQIAPARQRRFWERRGVLDEDAYRLFTEGEGAPVSRRGGPRSGSRAVGEGWTLARIAERQGRSVSETSRAIKRHEARLADIAEEQADAARIGAMREYGVPIIKNYDARDLVLMFNDGMTNAQIVAELAISGAKTKVDSIASMLTRIRNGIRAAIAAENGLPRLAEAMAVSPRELTAFVENAGAHREPSMRAEASRLVREGVTAPQDIIRGLREWASVHRIQDVNEGILSSNASQARARAGLTKPQARVSAEQRAEIISLRRDGVGAAEIAERLGLERATVNTSLSSARAAGEDFPVLNRRRSARDLFNHDDDDPSYSVGHDTRASSVEDLAALAESEFGADAEALARAGKSQLVNTASELPFPVPENADAVHYRGTSYFIADRMNAAAFVGKMLHEIGYHGGLEVFVGKRGFDEINRHMARMLDEGHPLVREAFEMALRSDGIEGLNTETGAYLVERAQRARTLGRERLDELSPRERKAALAYLIEAHAEMPLVQRVLASLRQWLIKTFGTTFGMRLTVDDIRSLAISALRNEAEMARRATPDVRGINGQNAGDLLQASHDGRRSDPAQDPVYRAAVARLQAALEGADHRAAGGQVRGKDNRASTVKDGDGPDLTLAEQTRQVMALSGVHIARIPNALLGDLRLTLDAPLELPPRLKDALQAQPPSRAYNTEIVFDVVENGRNAANPKAREGRRDGAYIRFTSVPDALRKSGLGSWMYRQLIDWAHRRGLTVYSDTSITSEAWPMYERLRQAKYDLEQVSSIYTHADGTRESTTDEPIWAIRQSYEETSYARAPIPFDDYQIDGQTLREQIEEVRARQEAYDKLSPAEQAIADDPGMKFSVKGEDDQSGTSRTNEPLQASPDANASRAFEEGPISGRSTERVRELVSYPPNSRESPIGRIEYQPRPDGSWQITYSSVDPALRGQKEGVALYEELIRRARAAGVQRITSDITVSPDAAHVYDALARRGYNIVRSEGEAGTPVYRIAVQRPDGSASSAGDKPQFSQNAPRWRAAVRDPQTGEIYIGANHAEAIMGAPESRWDDLMNDPAANGFMSDGRFISREQAMQEMSAAANRTRNIPARELLERVKQARAEAAEMRKGYEAAARCAARAGLQRAAPSFITMGMTPASGVSAGIGQVLGMTAAIPLGVTAAPILARAARRSSPRDSWLWRQRDSYLQSTAGDNDSYEVHPVTRRGSYLGDPAPQDMEDIPAESDGFEPGLHAEGFRVSPEPLSSDDAQDEPDTDAQDLIDLFKPITETPQ